MHAHSLHFPRFRAFLRFSPSPHCFSDSLRRGLHFPHVGKKVLLFRSRCITSMRQKSSCLGRRLVAPLCRFPILVLLPFVMKVSKSCSTQTDSNCDAQRHPHGEHEVSNAPLVPRYPRLSSASVEKASADEIKRYLVRSFLQNLRLPDRCLCRCHAFGRYDSRKFLHSGCGCVSKVRRVFATVPRVS